MDINLYILFLHLQVLHNHTIVYDIQYVPKEDSFRTTKKVKNLINPYRLYLYTTCMKTYLVTLALQYIVFISLVCQVCGQIEHGILALFGPSDLLLGSHMQSLCDALDIPHIEAR